MDLSFGDNSLPYTQLHHAKRSEMHTGSLFTAPDSADGERERERDELLRTDLRVCTVVVAVANTRRRPLGSASWERIKSLQI